MTVDGVIAPRGETTVRVGGRPALHGLQWGNPEGEKLVLLLHGCGGNALSLGILGSRLGGSLGPEYSVLSIDQRGYGDSEKPPTGYGPQEFAGDVLAIREWCGCTDLVLIGHSRGAWLAAYVAGSEPSAVSKLVLIDPARVVFDSVQSADDFYNRVRAGLGPFRDRQDALERLRAGDPDAAWTPARKESALAGLEEDSTGRLTGKLPRRVVDSLEAVRLERDWVGPLLGSVTAPTLLLVAGKSSAERRAQKLAYGEKIPTVKTVMLDTTHAMHHDMPEAVGELVTSFIVES